jgi:hypothetical protein
LKRELLDYSRRDIQSKNRQYTPQQVETALADELGYSLDGDRIHPLDVSIEELWDASEDHARSLYQRWVWPSLDE